MVRCGHLNQAHRQGNWHSIAPAVTESVWLATCPVHPGTKLSTILIELLAMPIKRLLLLQVELKYFNSCVHIVAASGQIFTGY